MVSWRSVATDLLTRQERWLRLVPLLRHLFSSFGREMEDRLRPLGLTRPQASVLKQLEPDGDGMPIVAMAQQMGCHSSNLTGLVDRLEARGAVRRVPHAEDRRVKVVHLTPAGADLRAAALEALSAPPQVVAGLDDEDLATLEALLARAQDGAPRA